MPNELRAIAKKRTDQIGLDAEERVFDLILNKMHLNAIWARWNSKLDRHGVDVRILMEYKNVCQYVDIQIKNGYAPFKRHPQRKKYKRHGIRLLTKIRNTHDEILIKRISDLIIDKAKELKPKPSESEIKKALQNIEVDYSLDWVFKMYVTDINQQVDEFFNERLT